MWLATFESGIHATIAGVVMGLLTPARPTDPGGFQVVAENATALTQEPDAESVRALQLQAQEVVSVAERLEHSLHPWTSFVVISLFALANAGLVVSVGVLRSAVSSPITLGIVLGLLGGKVLGITGMSWIALKLGVGALPSGVGVRQLLGAGTVAGIGFTVSLFITGLAFEEASLINAAKMGVLIASLLAGLFGALILGGGRLHSVSRAGDS